MTEMIDRLKWRIRNVLNGRPTSNQLAYIEDLGGDAEAVKSFQEASDTIEWLRRQGRSGFHARTDAHGQPPAEFLHRMRYERDLQEMLGIARGIIMDGVVTDSEAVSLQKWFGQHPDIVGRWPGNQVARRLDRILEDGVIDDEERQELAEIMLGLSGQTIGVEAKQAPSSLPFDSPLPTVEIPGRLFVFSGRFAYGPRAACRDTVDDLGGSWKNNITLKTDYLVIGTFASRDWKHGSFGRKIEKAVEYRDRTALAIIPEDHWAEAVP